MMDFLLRRFYTLWGFVMLGVPSVLCCSWFLITHGISDPAEAKAAFMGSWVLFSYYEVLWYVSLFFSTIPFLFGARLIRGSKQSKYIGWIMLCVAGAYIVFSLLKIIL